MLVGTNFYHATIRKLVVGMGTLFNDIKISQSDSSGNEVKIINVPISFAPRTAYWAKTNEVKDGVKIQKTLPRITFNFEGLEYDQERQLNPLNITLAPSDIDTNHRKIMLERVPYDFSFNVSVFTKTVEDGLQIIEQILPFFTPQYNLSIKEIPSMGIVSDVPVILNSIQQEDNYSDGFNENRLISWSLDFTLKGHLYRPNEQDVKIIKHVIVNLFADRPLTTLLEEIRVDAV